MDFNSDSEDFFLLDCPALRFLLATERSHYVDEIFAEREEKGEYEMLFEKLVKHPLKFSKHYAVTPSTFYYIFGGIEDYIHKASNFRTCISARERLAVTLRFLMTGLSFRGLSVTYRISASAISQIVYKTCRCIWDNFHKKHMPMPNVEDFQKISRDYWEKWNFPNCLGGIDGKHVYIKYSMMSSKKNKHSIILQGIADCNYKFIIIDVGDCQKVNCERILKQTDFYKLLQVNKLNLPKDDFLPGSKISAPYVFLGNDSYAMKTNVLKPYGKKINAQEQVFNERSAKARIPVERTFGLLFRKWKSLQGDLQMSPDNAKVIIKCVSLLHNILIDREGVPENVENVPFTSSKNTFDNRYNRCTISAKEVRDNFKTYFNSGDNVIKTECNEII